MGPSPKKMKINTVVRTKWGVYNMIFESRGEESHTTNRSKLFERLRKYQLKLNPSKCTFGVTSRMLLGFVVSSRVIEVDPDKIKAIQNLPVPRT